MGLWSELENQVRFPRCTCGKCECNIGKKLMKIVDEEKAPQFLMGLNNEKYSNIRGQILAIEPLLTLDKMFNMVHQEENHKYFMMNRDDKSENAVAFAVSGRNVVTTREKTTCKHCGKFVHEETGCFELIGYPHSRVSRGRGKGGRRNRGGCGGRVGSSHGRGGEREAANATVTACTPSGPDSTAATTKPVQVSIPGLSTEQMNAS